MEGGAIPEVHEDQRMYGPFWLGSDKLIYFIIAYHNVAVAGLKCIQVIYAIVSRTMRLPTHPLNLYMHARLRLVKVNNNYLQFKPIIIQYIVQHGIQRIYKLSQSATVTSYSKAPNVPTI